MNTYVRHCKVEVQPIIELIDAQLLSRKARADVFGHSVGVTSLRLRTFAAAHATGFRCVTCGLTPAFFAVETDAWAPAGTKPHLNLYGYNEEAEEVLFTHDHVLARGLGGRDHISNTQLMCLPCNGEKAKAEQVIVDQRRKEKL